MIAEGKIPSNHSAGANQEIGWHHLGRGPEGSRVTQLYLLHQVGELLLDLGFIDSDDLVPLNHHNIPILVTTFSTHTAIDEP